MNPEQLNKELVILKKEMRELKNAIKNPMPEKSGRTLKKRIIVPLCVLSAMLVSIIVFAATIPNTFNTGEVISATRFNTNFSYIISRLWDLNGSDLYYDIGNVGIGTSTPGSALDVAGTVTATIVNATSTVSAPAISAASSVTAPTISASTSVTAPTISATTSVTAPTINATTVTATGTVTAAAFSTGQGFKIQYGSGSSGVDVLSNEGSTLGTFNFGINFGTVPTVIVVTGTSAGAYQDCLILTVSSKTTTGFTLYAWNGQPSNNVTASITFNWIAIFPP